MSVSNSSSDLEEVPLQDVQYVCKRCPGQTFRSHERDDHRQFHREQRNNIIKNRVSPRGKKPQKRLASPSRTETGSLFSVTVNENRPEAPAGPKSKTRTGNQRLADAKKNHKKVKKTKAAKRVRVNSG